MSNDTNRISGGASDSMPRCPSCAYLNHSSANPGWGWCNASANRVFVEGWPDGFTPSQSPSGTCDLHPKRAAIASAEQQSPSPSTAGDTP